MKSMPQTIFTAPRRMLGRYRGITIGLLLGLLSASTATSGTAPARDSSWYYQIGGAQAVSAAANLSLDHILL